MIFVKNDIRSKRLTKHNFPYDRAVLFIELDFKKSKWFFLETYHPPSQNNQYYFDWTDNALDIYNNYDKVIFTGDFKAEEVQTVFETFLYQHDLKNLVEGGTCLKDSSCIVLYLTNGPLSLQHTTSVFTGPFGFHKIILTVFKTVFTRS